MSKRKCLSNVDKFEILNKVDNEGGIKKKIWFPDKFSFNHIKENRKTITKPVSEPSHLGDRKLTKMCVYEKVETELF